MLDKLMLFLLALLPLSTVALAILLFGGPGRKWRRSWQVLRVVECALMSKDHANRTYYTLYEELDAAIQRGEIVDRHKDRAQALLTQLHRRIR